MAEESAQSLVPQNDASGGFWNAFDRPVAQSLMAALNPLRGGGMPWIHLREGLDSALTSPMA